MTYKDWTDVLNIDVTGTWLMSKEVVNVYMGGHGGKIVNINSVNSFSASPVAPVYHVAKAAEAAPAKPAKARGGVRPHSRTATADTGRAAARTSQRGWRAAGSADLRWG